MTSADSKEELIAQKRTAVDTAIAMSKLYTKSDKDPKLSVIEDFFPLLYKANDYETQELLGIVVDIGLKDLRYAEEAAVICLHFPLNDKEAATIRDRLYKTLQNNHLSHQRRINAAIILNAMGPPVNVDPETQKEWLRVMLYAAMQLPELKPQQKQTLGATYIDGVKNLPPTSRKTILRDTVALSINPLDDINYEALLLYARSQLTGSLPQEFAEVVLEMTAPTVRNGFVLPENIYSLLNTKISQAEFLLGAARITPYILDRALTSVMQPDNQYIGKYVRKVKSLLDVEKFYNPLLKIVFELANDKQSVLKPYNGKTLKIGEPMGTMRQCPVGIAPDGNWKHGLYTVKDKFIPWMLPSNIIDSEQTRGRSLFIERVTEKRRMCGYNAQDIMKRVAETYEPADLNRLQYALFFGVRKPVNPNTPLPACTTAWHRPVMPS